uniref:Uncharacterized protein n=1 Tax=Anguilla anguilla TaxID=7936 RepID=A0A0E9URY9_ANGAN
MKTNPAPRAPGKTMFLRHSDTAAVWFADGFLQST